MKARIKIAGINTPEVARNLSSMIHKARKKARDEREGKRAFIERAEKEEAKNIITGFTQA